MRRSPKPLLAQASMRHVSLVAMVAVELVVVLSGTVLAQSDPFIGTWKQNTAKSKYDPASLTPKTVTTVHRQASGSGYKVTTDGLDPQGATTHTEYTTATLDGKDYPVKGSADYDSVSTKKIDANTSIYLYKRGGSVVRMYRSIVSKDGKTLTVDQIGYNAKGVAFHNVIVNDKQ